MIAILLIVSLAISLNGQVHGQELAFRIINTGEVPIESPDSGMKSWQPTTRGQFIQKILFGIHPNSPQNRDAWAQSGYLKLLAKRLKNTTADHDSKPKSDIMEPTKVKVPNRRKPILKGLSSKRIAKSNQALVTRREMNTTENVTATISTPFPSIIPVPIGIPRVFKKRTSAEKTPRCLIQSVVTPHQPVFYYLMPLPQPQPYNLMSLNKNNFPRAPLFSSAAPIQNRIHFPPMYLVQRPIPWDLLATETKNTPVSTSTPIPSSFDAEVVVASEKEKDQNVLPPVEFKKSEEVFIQQRNKPQAILEAVQEEKVSNVTEFEDETTLNPIIGTEQTPAILAGQGAV